MSLNLPAKNNNPATKGFTLVEVIVALGIGILIMTTFMAVTASGFRNIRTISQTKELHANAVYILNTLTCDIKQAENLNVLDLSTLEIKLSDSTIEIKQEIKLDGSGYYNITKDGNSLNSSDIKITNLEFIKLQKSVRINFTIESISGEVSLPITTTIAQRN